MYSAVFALTPPAATTIIQHFLKDNAAITEREIMDINERDMRNGRMNIRRYGIARTLTMPALVQRGKQLYHAIDETTCKQQIASFLSLLVQRDICILGGGSTTATIATSLDIQSSRLGVDIIIDGQLEVYDGSEADILAALDGRPAQIVVSPIGRQGCILGRGNQQISPEVIKKVGIENLIIAATPHKLKETPSLFVDTGDPQLDQSLAGFWQIITGYAIAQRQEIRCLTAPLAPAAST
jgi:predicted polyphosphate/ATP-dependent NAD kinase